MRWVTTAIFVQVTKTLGVIMGAFTVCWLPFFILALVRPFCHQYGEGVDIPDWLTRFAGYGARFALSAQTASCRGAFNRVRYT